MAQTRVADMSTTSTLRRGLSQRQLNMIALGGVIGAGLFVGSGVIIGEAGPGAFISYALCGVIVDGELGDYRPLRALAAAVHNFQPDQLVIAEARSSWLRLGLVDKARAAHPIPVTHVLSRRRPADLALSPLRTT